MVMWIFKRDGRKEPVAFDKVTARVSAVLGRDLKPHADSQINKLSYGLDPNFVEPAEITQKVVQGIHAGITTVELDVSHLYPLLYMR
jgi:ribonucleoside-diphosphate reductase subunit M1